MQPSSSLGEAWRQNLRVAAGFWGLYLALVAAEATFGANAFIGALFFVSVPALVGYLIWANHRIALGVGDRMVSLVLLGVAVLALATLIILVGLLAAAHLKTLMSGA